MKKTKKKITALEAKSLALEIYERQQAAKARGVNETVCDYARRIAREEQDAANREQEVKREAFLDTICAPHERVRNEDGTYTICGWRWKLRLDGITKAFYLVCHDTHFGRYIDSGVVFIPSFNAPAGGQRVYSLSYLGRALLDFDQQKARIDTEESRSLWSRFLSWFPKKSLHSRPS